MALQSRQSRTLESVGPLLRSRRQANALSQMELAERMKVSQATVSQWEGGRTKPSEEQLKALNQILGGVTATEETITEAESQSPIAAWLTRAVTKKNLTVSELASKAEVSLPTVYNILSGRAQNPHAKTIAALERILEEPLESKQELREASEVEGIGELIDFDPYDPKEMPNKAGVYVLYDISQRPIYVGKATKISSRLHDHSTRFWFKRPVVETGTYIEIRDHKLRDQIETVPIQFLKNNAVINKQKTVRAEDDN